mmetsp:Transcript_14311/g.42216  ORF Transcript_14311/g.42216 Transcript_14311/m.42216 type:complete len:215 (-) Transcript_14311:166-810(-)
MNDLVPDRLLRVFCEGEHLLGGIEAHVCGPSPHQGDSLEHIQPVLHRLIAFDVPPNGKECLRRHLRCVSKEVSHVVKVRLGGCELESAHHKRHSCGIGVRAHILRRTATFRLCPLPLVQLHQESHEHPEPPGQIVQALPNQIFYNGPLLQRGTLILVFARFDRDTARVVAHDAQSCKDQLSEDGSGAELDRHRFGAGQDPKSGLFCQLVPCRGI